MFEPNKYWFAPKVYGWGLVPISREGWLITVSIILFLVLITSHLTGIAQENNVEDRKSLLYVLAIIVVSFFPFLFVKKRMKGTLKRRRGVKDIDRE